MTSSENLFSLICFTRTMRGLGLSWNHQENALQFLDLRLEVTAFHACWYYMPRWMKGVLLYSSSPTKVVKTAIISTKLRQTLQTSCEHNIESSFRSQVHNLVTECYPHHLLAFVAGKLPEKVKCAVRKQREASPHIRVVSYSLKNIGSKHGVPVGCRWTVLQG